MSDFEDIIDIIERMSLLKISEEEFPEESQEGDEDVSEEWVIQTPIGRFLYYVPDSGQLRYLKVLPYSQFLKEASRSPENWKVLKQIDSENRTEKNPFNSGVGEIKKKIEKMGNLALSFRSQIEEITKEKDPVKKLEKLSNLEQIYKILPKDFKGK